MPASAIDVVSPAFRHTVQQLFKPFRFGQWVRLAIAGLLAGELGSGGGGLRYIGGLPRGGNRPQVFFAQAVPPRGMLLVIGIALLILIAVVVFVALVYVSSMMRFVLFDSVVARECHIRRFWSARRSQGFHYFVFHLVFFLVMLTGLAMLIGIAAAIGFTAGWLRDPRQHILPLIIGGLVFFAILAAFVIAAALVAVLTKDFVVPQMALENVGIGDGWSRLWQMIRSEKGGFAGYVGFKILLSIAATVALGIAALFVAFVLAIPMAVIALVAIFGGRAIGLVWNPVTLAIAIVAACIAVAVILFAMLLTATPIIVFFPAYAIYFFAARYPRLAAALNPPAPAPGAA